MKHWEKIIRRASAEDQARVAAALALLKQRQFPPDTIKLKGFERYRTRVGDWRIFFHYEGAIVVPEDIERRDDHSY